MSELAFDAFSRRAGDAVSRRSSLMTLGSTVLAAMVAMPSFGVAGKSGKSKNKNKSKKQAKKQSLKLCQQQVGQCQTFINAECQGNGCGTVVAVCCPLLGTCQNEAFFTCLVDAFNQQPTEATDS
jgi:hypothetical protein